jgi:ubiquitin-protein ligase
MGLPEDILRVRLQNELEECRGYLRREIEGRSEVFPMRLQMRLDRVPGPIMQGEKVVNRYEHAFVVHIDSEYPFQRPRVQWLTPIFHPNIMMPEDGGMVCTRLLSEWGFRSTLLSFIKGIEALLASPNPESPFGTNSCILAARHFEKMPYRSPPALIRPLPRVVAP